MLLDSPPYPHLHVVKHEAEVGFWFDATKQTIVVEMGHIFPASGGVTEVDGWSLLGHVVCSVGGL